MERINGLVRFDQGDRAAYSLQANRKGFSAFYDTPPCAKKTQELLNLIERRKLLHFIGHKKTREAK
jgi:hypothetical protein